jgi:thymidylate synthase
MNRLDIQYQNLLRDIIDNGTEKEDRTGTGTISVFGRQFRHNMQDGFPLLSTKKMAVKTMMTELKWFLKGDTNIKYLVDNGCNIWNGDAYKKYAEQLVPGFHGPWYTQEQFIELIKTNEAFARDWGELGPIYGKQWRDWNVKVPHKTMDEVYHTRTIDQIQNLINELKTNPNSRRLMVSAWNVGELNEMTLPPCHYGFQLNVRGEYLDLMWNQRSVDTFLGLPFNIASYGLLLSLIAYETGYKPGSFIGSLGDTHLYTNHIEQAKEQIKRTSFELPTLNIISSDLLNGEFEVEFENYQAHPAIKAPLSN